MRRCAMAAPILPIPATPICIGCALLVGFPLRRRSVPAAGGDHTGLCAREKDRAFALRRAAILSLNAAAPALYRPPRGLALAKGKVGIVGLGIRGGAFARNLLAAGWRVVGYDIDAARRRAMARAGVEIADDAKTLAREVGTIITSLPKPAALDATVKAI